MHIVSAHTEKEIPFEFCCSKGIFNAENQLLAVWRHSAESGGIISSPKGFFSGAVKSLGTVLFF